MSTQTSEEDWEHTLMVFRACLPRRGRKAADDRKFLEAMHFFTVENVRWRALPKEYGNWNTVWKRFERLSKAGVREAQSYGRSAARTALLALARIAGRHCPRCLGQPA
jgi:transposase